MLTQQATTSDIQAVYYWLKHPPNGYSYTYKKKIKIS